MQSKCTLQSAAASATDSTGAAHPRVVARVHHEQPPGHYAMFIVQIVCRRVASTAHGHALATRIQKSASPAFLTPGETLTYTLTISQHLPLTMTNVMISDVLPADVDFIGATQPYDLNGDTLRWTIDQVEAGGQESLQLVVEAHSTEGLWTIVNQTYWLRSDEMPDDIYGVPISVTVATDFGFFPLILNGP